MIRVTLRAGADGTAREIVVGTKAQADHIAAVLQETQDLAFAAGREAALHACPTLSFKNAKGETVKARIATREEAEAVAGLVDAPPHEAVQAFVNNRPCAWLSMKDRTIKPVRFVSNDEAQAFNTWAAEQTQPAPLPVAIASMPTRITETTVARDGDGEIKKTTQTEKDA